jgi:hypothetical protein
MITGVVLVRPSTEQRARTKPHWQINSLEQSFQDLIRTIHSLGDNGYSSRVSCAAETQTEQDLHNQWLIAKANSKMGMVPRRGLEPPHPFGYQHLKLARLPIPPSGRRRAMYEGHRVKSTGFLKFSCQAPKNFQKPS